MDKTPRESLDELKEQINAMETQIDEIGVEEFRRNIRRSIVERSIHVQSFFNADYFIQANGTYHGLGGHIAIHKHSMISEKSDSLIVLTFEEAQEFVEAILASIEKSKVQAF